MVTRRRWRRVSRAAAAAAAASALGSTLFVLPPLHSGSSSSLPLPAWSALAASRRHVPTVGCQRRIAGSLMSRAATISEVDYWSFTVQELRGLLKDRGLKRKGRKRELVERLEAADAAASGASDEPEVEQQQGELGRGAAAAGAAAAGGGDAKVVRPGDTVYLRTHTGRHLDVEHEDSDVLARWEDHGDWQAFVIEKSPLVIEKTDSTIFQSGDVVFLRAHTGRYIDVEENWVRARWDDQSHGMRWQGLVIVKHGSGAIAAGDTVFLQASSDLYIDVQYQQALARWEDEGAWQALVIEK